MFLHKHKWVSARELRKKKTVFTASNVSWAVNKQMISPMSGTL
jgi:hypothetical protein